MEKARRDGMNLIFILALVVLMGYIAVKNDDSKCRIPIWIAFALTLGIFLWQLFEGVL